MYETPLQTRRDRDDEHETNATANDYDHRGEPASFDRCEPFLEAMGDDPALPETIVPYRCVDCGAVWHFDVTTGEHTLDC